ncbi:MAG: ATP-binding cassette domain-containing protein, partial [Candidatus Pacebacteria bacterium]|nr:ATP-binding cassette domain-containing protein [Candidatus Paceibacterota bacterium]
HKEGVLTIGDFVLFQTYIISLVERLWGFGHVIKALYQAFADGKEMVEILDTPYGVEDVPNAGTLKVTEGKIDFTDVVFNFNETRTVLDKFSLSIAPGEKIAFIGPSGAGKTTVTKLLFRFYDLTSGAITIDGQEISKMTQDSLRDAMALVPQEPILFHRSLMDNIRYGRRDATDEEVMEAAKKARCHEFISSLPDGYETMVGERGVKLSGGERQRVAIARAILKDAPILVLDEATSSLDSESEHLIQEALNILMEGKTVIVIAHRLSTIITMDRIIVIEGGNIRAMGTHDQLLKKDELYKKLWSIQAGGFLKEEE